MNRKWIFRGVALAGIGLLLWCFPIFHMVSLSDKRMAQAAATFNPAQLVETVWNGPLSTTMQTCPELVTFANEFRENPQQTLERYGRVVGVSSKRHFQLRFEGVVIEKDANRLLLQPHPGNLHGVMIEVQNGPVFGNAVRDGCALFRVGDFTDTRKFNDISAELNRRVEQDILPQLFMKVNRGETVAVTGCFTLNSRNPSIEVIPFIPIAFEVR